MRSPKYVVRRAFPAALALSVLAAAPCFPQGRGSAGREDRELVRDHRPFGKYLVEICTLSGEQRTLQCVRTPLPNERPGIAERQSPAPRDAGREPADQTISLSLVCEPDSKKPCNPQPPLVAGNDFFVSGSSDSGLSVRQTVEMGSATPVGGSGTVRYRANEPGTIVIRATQGGNAHFSAAAPVDLIIQVVAGAKDAGPGCAVLPPSPAPQITLLDAGSIVSLMGNPTPFTIAAQGRNTIAIYAARQPLEPDERRILFSLHDAITALAGRTAGSLGLTPASKPFTLELAIPHASALSDLAARINALNYSQFTVQDVGSDKVRITAASAPDCDTWQGFLSDIRRMEWQFISEPMSTKLFYLSSTDVATAFGSLVPAAPAAQAPAAAPASAPSPSAPPAAAITVAQPPGSNVSIISDTTPCVLAGLATGNSNACGASPAPTGGAAAPPAPASGVSPAPRPPLGMANVSVAAGNGEQTPPDLLVFSDANPGDDAQVLERNRVIAQLDLPRPEMIINAWVTQNSSANQEAIGGFVNMVRDMIAQYNDRYQDVGLNAWESVKLQAEAPDFYNDAFRAYVSRRFVGDTYRAESPGTSVQELSQAFLERSQAELADPAGGRAGLGICARGVYCLGYSGLFDRVRPGLTELLLTVIAAQNSVTAADTAIAAAEQHPAAGPLPSVESVAACDGPAGNPYAADKRARCRAIWSNLNLDSVTPAGSARSCADRDYRGAIYSLLNLGRPVVYLQCFKEKADMLLRTAPAAGGVDPYGVGLMRAAVADFLFNYKVSQQYPHEFAPYDLSHSADTLNSALNPLIEAFNRDLANYQIFVRADMQYRVERLNTMPGIRSPIKRIFGLDKPSFFNDGLVTVRTISGQGSYVNTTSQSFLNASTAPQLSALVNSLGTSSGSGSTPLAGAFLSAGPLGKAEALSSLLANYQATFAQIGRSLQFSVIPRTLSTASSAEIAITLNADDSANGPLYTGAGATDPSINTSRVANHDTVTRVRVDSVKLFEVSSLSAIVERSRSRFPLLPPFVEIPYIGTFAGFPLGPAKEFHSSTAILSAFVVPTAADITYGLRFVSDLMVDGVNPGPCGFYKGAAGPDVPNACLFRKALSLRDLNREPVAEFNHAMVRCFASDTSRSGCLEKVRFDNVPAMHLY